MKKRVLVPLLLLGWTVSLSQPAAPEKPNIIMILADDLGYGDIGGYFGGNAATPNLTRLAQEGMLFTDFHSNGPVCSPTRAALLTGRYPQRLGVEVAQHKVMELPRNADEITMAQYLKKAGYATGMCGKWHIGQSPEGNPVRFGFDEFIGYENGDLDYYSKISRSGEPDWWHNEQRVTEEGYVTKIITDHSIEFIAKHQHEPFFLYVSHLAIHFPWQGPEDSTLWARREGTDYSSNKPGPTSKLGPNPPEKIPAVIKRMTDELDNSVGEIMAALHARGLARNTMVFFMSDNGAYVHYNGDTWPQVGSNGPLRGQKMDVLEGGHRVPAIAWWPGKIPALSVTNQTAMTMDLLPTFLDVLNVPLPAKEGKNKLDGVSLLPLLLKETPLTPRTLYWRIRDLKAVRQGYWKLVSGNNSVALYDLANDIGEAKDVAKEYPDIVRALESKLALWEKDVDK